MTQWNPKFQIHTRQILLPIFSFQQATWLYRIYLVVGYLVRHHAKIGEPDGEGRLAALTVLPEARPDPIMLRIIGQARI